MTSPEPGVYPGLSRAEYDAWQLPSYSFLKLFLDNTPAKIAYLRDHPKDPSTAMQEGDWIDALLYDRDRLPRDFVAEPKDAPVKRGKANMIWWAKFEAENKGKSVIKRKLYDEAEVIVDAFYAHPTAGVIQSAKHKQLAVVWDDPDTGIRLKALIDTVALYDGWTCLIDVKTTGYAPSSATFGRMGSNLHYPMQAYMYTTGLNIVAPYPRRWLWVVMERSAPFEIATYYADEDAMTDGEHDFRKAIGIYKNCMESDYWPSFPTEPQPFELPGWKRKALGF